MARRKSKSVRAVSDRNRPWSERIAAARKAVEQIPSSDWKNALLTVFLDEVEAELVDRNQTPEEALAAALE